MRLEFVFFITRLLQNCKTLFSLYGLPLISVMCRENIHTPPFPSRKGTEIPKGGEDVKREAISKGVGGCLKRYFSRGFE